MIRLNRMRFFYDPFEQAYTMFMYIISIADIRFAWFINDCVD